MSRVPALAREELEEFEDFFKMVEGGMGFLPNSMLTLGRRPEILRAFAGLAAAVFAPGKIAPGLRSLISHVASRAAGCRYCQAHTGHNAVRMEVPPEKLQAAFEFESSPLFDEAERSALRLAAAAAVVPNAATDAHFAELRKHFDDEAIVEIVAVISLFGFLNRWNDTMATDLEGDPLRFARENLSKTGWEPGKHAS